MKVEMSIAMTVPMDKPAVLKHIHDVGVIPVVRASSPEEAILAVEALEAGGLSLLEITMTVPRAVNVIERLSDRYGEKVVVGAGTVLDADTARSCIQAGARFVVGPSLNIEVIELCRSKSVVVFPGTLTPTEIVTAWQAGADAVKVFPCGAMGGPKYLASLKAPLPQIQMIPTGGVSLLTARDFITAGAFALGVGADLVDLNAIRSGESEKVVQAARAYIAAVSDARRALSPQ